VITYTCMHRLPPKGGVITYMCMRKIPPKGGVGMYTCMHRLSPKGGVITYMCMRKIPPKGGVGMYMCMHRLPPKGGGGERICVFVSMCKYYLWTFLFKSRNDGGASHSRRKLLVSVDLCLHFTSVGLLLAAQLRLPIDCHARLPAGSQTWPQKGETPVKLRPYIIRFVYWLPRTVASWQPALATERRDACKA